MKRPVRKTNTVYEHIWRSIAAVVALVFALGGTAVTIYVDQSMTAQVKAREQAYLGGVDTILTHQISSAQQMLNMLLTNPFIMQSIYSGNESWNTFVYQAGQIVVNAVNSNQTFNSIYVISGDEIAIKSSRRYQTPEAEARLIQNMQLDFRRTLIPWHCELGSRTSHNLMILSALDTVSTPNFTGGALINLDLDRLADTAFANHGDSTVYMIMGDQVVASSNMKASFTDVASHELLAKAIASQAQLCDGYYVFSLSNPTYGYTLYSVQERAALMRPVTMGLAILLAVISGLLLVTLLLSRRAALHAYTPVKTILIQLEEQLPSGEESAEELNDLQRVSHTIRRTSEIVSAYRRDADTARLSRFIQSGAADHYIADMLEKHLGYTGEQPLYMLLFHAESPENARMAADVLQGSLDGYARFLTLDMPGQRLLSLACAAQMEAEDGVIHASIEQVLHLMRQQSAGKVIISLQRTDSGQEALPEAYIQLIERMRRSVFCAGSALLLETQSASIPEETAQQLYRAALIPDSTGYLEAATAYLAACRRMPAREAYHQLATLCMRITEASSSRSMDMSDRLDSYRMILNTLFTLPDYDAVIAYMQTLHQSVIEHINVRKAGESNPLADHILAYMHTHFDDPGLSAMQVAEALSISVSHLSRVMGKSIGCGFPELLQKIRLEHAVTQLMAQPGLSIAQLAQECGFSSASYFTASFKKKYGVTPSTYRLNRAGDERKDV